MRRVGFSAATVEICGAHALGRHAQCAGHTVNDFLDDQHGLGSAETPERGLRGGVGPGHPAGEMHVRDVVDIVQMEEGAMMGCDRSNDHPPSETRLTTAASSLPSSSNPTENVERKG